MNVIDRLKEIDAMSLSDFDNLNELGERIDEFWNPKPEGNKNCNVGHEFKGMYVGVQTFNSDTGPYDKFKIKTVDGKLWGLKDVKILREALEKLQPGDAVYIKYNGKVKPKKGMNMYHDFDIKGHKFNEVPEELKGAAASTTPPQSRKMDKEEDDPQGITYIEELEKLMHKKGVEINAENVVAFAEHNQKELEIEGDLWRIKRQVDLETKKGRWAGEVKQETLTE